ncbi:MAG: potassium-transporting ATPase subunit KdpA [Reyranellaceae bacterium]
MTVLGWAQIALYVAVIAAIVRPFGGFIYRVVQGERTWLSPVLVPVERGLYRLSGIDPKAEQSWKEYALAMLVFNLAGIVLVYAIQRLQAFLPFNPQDMAGVAPDLAFNTAVSFVTNTNWQNYGGESTLSYLTQMAALTVQNFVSAATGVAIAVALSRAFARTGSGTIGNFWTDLTRITFYVLLPVSFVAALFFVWQGVPQTLSAYVDAATVEGGKQTIALGPVASQLSIKMFGTNGGGFFNSNSAHPFENPTALSNFVQMVLIFALGAALTNVFGRIVGDERQGWALLAAMGVLFISGVLFAYWSESGLSPALAAAGVDPAGGNMEGKEVRFGIAATSLFAVITTAASCGAVNGMHDSFTALGGMIPLINILLGEIIVGGVGAGLYGMLVFCILSVFIAGLMVGRTPEYVGKKIEAREIKMAVIAILAPALAVLGAMGLAAVLPAATAGVQDPGPHGFTEMLYATASAAGNNGSAFAGLTGNSLFWNSALAVNMFIGRFAIIVPVLAIAGSLAAKRKAAQGLGTLPTHGLLWVGLLVGVILIVGGLTFLPALTLGPIAEHLAGAAGKLF